MKLLSKVGAIFDRTLDLSFIATGVLVIFMMLSVGMEVTLRFLRGGTVLTWVMEVSEYSLLFMTFLGSAWMLRGERHVKMDLVLTRLNPGARAVLNFITSILGAIICFVLVWYGVKVTWEFLQTGVVIFTELQPLKWPILAVIPVGCFFLFVQFLRRAYGHLQIVIR